MKERIRILVDGHLIDRQKGGSATYIIGLFNALSKNKKYHITLALRNPIKVKGMLSEDIKIKKLNSHSTLTLFLFEYPLIFLREKYEFAHFTYFSPFLVRSKVLLSVHDLIFWDYPQYYSTSHRLPRIISYYLSIKTANKIYTISQYSAERISQLTHTRKKKIHITPCSSSLTKNSNTVLNIDFIKGITSRKYLLYVSRIEKRKNHLFALTSLVNSGLTSEYNILFVGHKDEKIPELESLIHKCNEHSERVIILSDIDEPNLAVLYKNAEVFIYPSLAEGFGIPPLEAIMLNCKTICSNSTSMKEFTFLKEFQFDPKDESDFIACLRRALNTPHDRYPFKQMIEEINVKYNWERASNVLNSSLK